MFSFFPMALITARFFLFRLFNYCLISFCRRIVKLFCSIYWENPRVTADVHYFHHYHIHYHCKIHLYCLKSPLSIPLCNMIICLFQLILSSFYRHIFFPSLVPSFLFFTPSKRTQNWFATIRHTLDVLFILIYISIVIYTVYSLLYLHLLAYTYLHLLIYTCVLFILLYELDKVLEIWGI